MGEQPSGGRARRLLRGLAVATGSLAVALVAAELGLRWLAPQGLVTEHFRYEALPGGEEGGPGYRLQPGLFLPGRVGGRINSLGLRGAEPPADDGRERLVVVGDSFVYGAGVAEGEGFVAGLAGSDLRVVLNAGTPGYGTARELAWLETFGDELAPDRLLLCVFVGNDLTDNLDPSAPRVVDGRLFFDEGGDPGDPGDASGDRARIWRNSLHLWRLWDRARQGTAAPPAAAPTPVADEGARAAAIERMHDAFAQKEASRLEVYLREGGPDSEELRRMDTAYAMTRLALEGVAAWCAERDVELGVLLIPDVVQVDGRLRARVLAGVGLAEGDLDWQRPQRALAGWCATLGLAVLDLQPAMAARQELLRADGDPTDMGLYLFGDSHWSAAGHAFAAAELQQAWRAGGAWGPGWSQAAAPR